MSRTQPQANALRSRLRAVVLAMVAASSLPSCERGIEPIRAGTMTLRLSPETGRIVNVDDGAGRSVAYGHGGLYFFDGKSGKEMFPEGIADVNVSGRTTTFSLSSGDPELAVACRLWPFDSLTRWTVTLTNRGSSQRLIELRLGLPIVVDATWQYWDGYDGDLVDGPTRVCSPTCNLYACNAVPTVSRGDDSSGRSRRSNKWLTLGNAGMFPLNVLCSSRLGIALGVSPEQPLSYYAGGLQPSSSPRESFYYAVKLVIDPGKSETCTFVLFGFEPTYGYRKAIEIYQRHFADTFRVRDGLDPRVLLCATGSYLFAHHDIAKHKLTDLWGEFCRRYFVGWTWLYAPFQRSGDFWPEADTFDVKYWRRPRPDSPKTIEEYRRAMVEGNRACGEGCAVAYYVIPQRCHRELADGVYADSRVVRINGAFHRGGAVLGWPLTSMYAMHNTYGRNCEREIDQILRHAHVDGIAFDNAFAHDMHQGGGMQQSSGRAFMDGKPYVLNHLGYKHLMDCVRRTDCRTPRGFHPAVFANGPYNVFTAQATDAALIEYHPYPPANVPGRFAALRYLLGPHKPISFKVHGRSKSGQVMDKRRPPQEEIEVQMNLRLYSLIAMLRWGSYPRVREALGSADLIDALPVLVGLRRAGWQPVSAVKGGEGLWIERFGAGPDTHLVLINPTEKPFAGTLTFDHEEAGLGPTNFERIYGHGALDCRIDADRSRLDVSIDPVWFQVLRVKGAAKEALVRVAPNKTAVRDLPYVTAGKPNVAIVCPAGLPEAARDCAGRIRTYFVYLRLGDAFELWCMSNGRTPVPDPKSAVVPAIVSGPGSKTAVTIVLALDRRAAAPSIEIVHRKRVTLTASTPAGLLAATDTFLRLLDGRFRRYGYDGWLKEFPEQAGQLAPSSTLFRRRGWSEFLAFMQDRYRRKGKK